MWFHDIHPAISAILDDILDVLERWNTTTSCQSNSPNATTVDNYQKKRLLTVILLTVISSGILL